MAAAGRAESRTVRTRWVRLAALVFAILLAVPSGASLAEAPVPQGRTVLTLPFDGDWSVTWGGITLAQNYHGRLWPLSRYAFDFSGVNEQGQHYRGDGRRVTDYFGYGRPILAPAAGRIIFVENGRPDAVPRTQPPMTAVANTVRIQHDSGDVSSLLHLQPGSIVVSVGQRVAARQMVARCGNSGYSTGPHLHYNLQRGTTPDRIAVLASFAWIWVQRDGAWTEEARYSPIKGQLIRQGDYTRLTDMTPSGTPTSGISVQIRPGQIILDGR
ncbi:MAG: M23 family metallopeptidase [Candidatus Sericytochromatia bacterium]|nr:M23 family metallopeptidase [Candidatus Sericytochromatia bacterium]